MGHGGGKCPVLNPSMCCRLMLTDEVAIYHPGAYPDERRPLPSPLGPTELSSMRFAEGSMEPKVRAASLFVRQAGGAAAVGSMERALQVAMGEEGTRVVPDEHVQR
jgi:carbamate kinase